MNNKENENNLISCPDNQTRNMIPCFLNDLCRSQSYDPDNFFLVAGPCVVESEELVMEIADKVSAICKRLAIPYVFKASYRKANRTSAGSFTGIGDDNG